MIYEATVEGDVPLVFEADFAQASCRITVILADGEEKSTPFQVGGCRHCPNEAAEKLGEYYDLGVVGDVEEESVYWGE